MNVAENTPGYPLRLQIVFTLRDGKPRAWLLTEMGGRGVLIPVGFDQAAAYIRQGLADEVDVVIVDTAKHGRQVRFVEIEKEPGGCGCQHAAKARAPQGRRAGDTLVGEPLFGVAETTGVAEGVFCCGEECTGEADKGGVPSHVRFDRYSVADDGYSIGESVVADLPKNLVDRFEKRGPACLPWVRISRDPTRFRQCLAKARAIGPMSDAKAVYKLVGPHLEKEDTEVFLAILLDPQLQVRAISEIARGSRDRAFVSVPDTLRIAIVDGAISFIVVHNHPSGRVDPSESDKELTEALAEAAATVKLQLLDHLIIGSGRFYSFADHGDLK
jgi:hypothetical protein